MHSLCAKEVCYHDRKWNIISMLGTANLRVARAFVS